MAATTPLVDLDRALAAAVAAAAPSVVHVRRPRDGGSGIAWAEDLVVTASFHTPDATQIGLPDEVGELVLHEATVVGRDPGTDVALLRVTGAKLVPATFREIDEVDRPLAVGNLALALGRPGKVARASMRMVGVLGPSIRTPHNAKLDRYVESDRQIPRGFAGGPLIDSAGAVIGMNTRTLLRHTDLAIPTQTLRRVVDELLAHGGIRRGYLGIGAYPAQLSAPLAALVGKEAGDRAALVASIDDGGPAATAGVQVGDILVELDGVTITDPGSLRRTLGDRPGATVALVILRGGTRVELTATLGAHP